MKKILLFLLTVLMLGFAAAPLSAQEFLTVHDGTATNGNVPVHGLWADAYLKAEFVIPAEELLEMSGGEIIGMTFYASQSSLSWGNANFQVFMTEVDATVLSAFTGIDNATIVYEGSLSIANNQMAVTLSSPYTYNGGNLLIGVYNTSGGTYASSTWYGETANGASIQGYNSSSLSSVSPSQQNFLPKTTFTYIPGDISCHPVSNLNVSGITSDNAVVAWNASEDASSYILQYKTPNQGWNDENVNTEYPTDTTYDFSYVLTANTTYDVRVASLCGSSDTSFWRSTNFRTACGAIEVTEDVPWFEDCEGFTSTTLVCWATPIMYNNSYPNALLNYGQAAHSGIKTIEFKGNSNMLVLPEFTNDIHELQLSFWATGYSYSSTSATIGVITDVTDPSTFEPVCNAGMPGDRGGSGGGNGNFMGPYYFNNVEATSGRIAILYSGPGSSSGWNMDDFTVELAPTCSPVTNLQVSDIYGSNASLSWNANVVGETVGYNITVTNNTTEVTNTLTTTETSYVLLGLDELSSYTVAVQPDCGGGDIGEAVTVSFSTPCIAPVEVINNSYPTSTYTTEGNHFPMSNHYLNSFTEQIYYPDELSNTSAEFSGMSFQYNDASAITRTLDIYMAHTADEAFVQNVWATPLDEYVHVYSGPVAFNRNGENRWVDIAFDTNFYYNGYDNLLLIVNDITGSEVNNSNAKFYTIEYSGVNRSQCEYSHDADANWSITNMPTTGRVKTQVNNIRLTACNQVTCIAPNTLALGYTDAHSAEISWVNPNASQNAEIEYKDDESDWTSAGAISGSEYTLNGLEANTVYQVRVRAICSTYDQSDWSQTLSFRTECDAITAEDLPYYQDFETGIYNAGSDNYLYCWDRYTTDPAKTVQVYSTTATHGNTNSSNYSNLLKINDGANVVNMAIMPKVDESVSLNQLQVSFWVRKTSSSSPVIFELGVMTDNSDPTSFEVLDTIPTGDWALVEYSLQNYTGYGQYVAFRFSKGNGSNNLRLDDVTLGYIPQCQHPVDLVVDAVTAESVDLHWTEVGDASMWHVEYGLAGFTPGEGDLETVYDTFHTISGLTPNTEYDVYVWADCGGLESTSIDATFRTDCGPIVNLPYSEDFETGIYTASPDNYILCWGRSTSDPSHYVYTPSSTSHAHSGTHFLDFHYTPSCYVIAIAPELDQSFDVSQLMVNFWACHTYNGYSGTIGTLEVGVMTDKNADSTFVPIDTIEISSSSAYAYTEQFVKFDNYDGDGKYIAFRMSNSVNCGYYVDDLTIDYAPSCSPVNDVEVSEITGTTAMVSWTPGFFGTVESYTLEYSVADMEDWTSVDNISETSYLLSGLEFSTDYDLRVKPNCDDLSTGDWVTISFRTKCLVGGDFTIGDGTSSYYYLPSYSYYKYSYSQQLFLASEIGSPKTLESITLEKTAGSSNRTYKIYLMHTSATSGDEWIDASDATLVFDNAQQLQNGFNTFTFSEPFEYNGTDNLLLIMLDMTGSWESGNTWRTHTAPFTASRYVYQDGSAYSTTSTPSGGSNTSNRNNVLFGAACDNSTCASPVITVADITSDGATVNWVAGYQESSWEMEYKRASDTIWIEMGTVTSMSEELYDLIPNTAYQVRMRSICDGGEYSYWADANFTTACGALTVTEEEPWTEDFETNTTMACFETPVTYVNSSGSSYPKMLLNYGQAAHSGGNSAEFKGTSNMLVLPEFTNDIHELRMSFWATSWGVTTTAVVGVLEDLNDTATFVALGDAGTPGGRGSSAGGNGNFMGPFDFNNIQAESGRIAILFTGTTASDAGWNLDDFTVELIPSCSAPTYTSVTVDNVTANSAEVSFIDDDPNHDAWIIYYGVTGTPTETWNSEDAYSTTDITISDLTSNTNYSLFVKTVCGGEPGDDQTNTVSFTTTTVPTTLPYITGFEDESDNNEWGILNGTQANKWYIGAPTDETSDVNTTVDGTNGLYISKDGGASNTYQSTESRVYAYRDILVPDGTTELVLSFDWKAQGGSYNYEFLRVYWLDPSVVTLTAGNNPPTVNGVNYDAAGQPGNYGPNASEHWLSLQSTWQHKEMIISADQFTGMGNGDRIYRLVFHWRNTYYSSNPPAAVDNIELRAITCATPTGLSVSDVGENEATVAWIGEADSYGVTITSATGTDYQTTTSNSLTLTNLNSSTAYQATVRAFCGTDSSMLSQPISFTTACGPISVAAAPWSTGFEGTDEELLACWVSASTGYRNGHTYPHIEPTSTIAHSGSRALEVAFGDIVTALPLFVEDLSTLQVSFWAYNNHWSSQNAVLELGYMTDPYDSATFVSLQSLTDQTYTQTTRTFADLAGLNLPSSTRIAFRFIRPNGSSDLTSWYVDDIEVSLAEPVVVIIEPTVVTNEATDITQSSAKLQGEITDLGNQTITARGFEWRLSSSSTYTSVGATGTSMTYNLSDLAANTSYTYRAFATTANTTTYGEEVSFTTLPNDTPEPCDVPTGLHVVENGIHNESIEVAWDANDNAEKWNLRHRPVNGEWTTVTALNENSYTINGLVGLTTYEIEVQADCGDNNVSDWSGFISVQTTNVGIVNFLDNSVMLFPNPAREYVDIRIDGDMNVTALEVYDVYGKLINTVNVVENPTRINVAGLANGMYFVRVSTDNGAVTKTFVKK